MMGHVTLLLHDLAALPGTMMLVASFALLVGRDMASAITAYAVQAALLALGVVVQAWLQGSVALLLVAGLTIAAKVVAVPWALRLADGGSHAHRFGLGGVPASALAGLAGVALVALGAWVTTQHGGAARLGGAGLAVPLGVVLLAGLAMARPGNPRVRAIGALALENGAMLAAVEVPGLAGIAGIALAALGLPAAVAWTAWRSAVGRAAA